jgi:hypothetical protein
LAGAEMMTFLTEPPRCLAASSRLVKKPVDSMTTSAPTDAQSMFAGSFSSKTVISVPVDAQALGGLLHRAGVAAEDRVVLDQVRQGGVVGQVVERDELDVGAGRLGGAEDVAADAAEAVDAYADGHVAVLLRSREGAGEGLRTLPTCPSEALTSRQCPPETTSTR